MERYLQAHGQQFEHELGELVRIPSVSADTSFRCSILHAAEWVTKRLGKIGFASQVIQTSGHPLVFAQSPQQVGLPTVLVYGHYDVQPPDPLELWKSPPFEPVVRDGKLFARGASDDKGQFLTHILSAQAWMETAGRLPVNLKFLLEGEEEVGSTALGEFLPGHAELLACDCVVISDGAQFAPGQPAITYGLRGIAYYDLVLIGPDRDLHSGTFGGSVTNPANALAKLLAALVDQHGRIQVPGFYDDVAPLSAREREEFARLQFDESGYFYQIGLTEGTGEEGYTTLERRWARPTCDVNGLWGGYQGEGAKTVLPSRAGAKLSFRLVPCQDPDRVTEGLRALLERLCPPGITLELHPHHNSPGIMVPLESPYIQAAARAIEQTFGRAPVFTREGGSIPIVATFHEVLGADTLLIGWGQDDDNTHSPNECFSLADFHRGIHASAKLWEEIGRLKA